MSKQGSSRLTKSLCVLTYLKIHPNQSREKFNRRICLFCFFGSYYVKVSWRYQRVYTQGGNGKEGTTDDLVMI
jgi:hypothetical protein